MILPIGDQPNPRGVPLVTNGLIAANVGVYLLVSVPLLLAVPDPRDPVLHEYARVLAERLEDPAAVARFLRSVSAYDLFVFTHGFRPVDPSIRTLFVSLFLHGGLLHLAGNMLFLWIYGDNVEHRLGRLRYLLAYLATGVAATLTHAAFDRDSPIPMIGASGAISGVLGFYFLWFPRNQVRLLWLLPPFVMEVFLVPARLVLGLYLIADNLLPFLLTRAATGVAYGAHIGRFVAGLVAAWVLDRRLVTARPREYARESPGRAGGGDEVLAAIAEGRFEDAATAYFSLPPAATRRLLPPAAALALADWLRAHGHPEAALVTIQRLLRDHPRGPGQAEAHVTAGRILLHDLRQPTPAYQHFLDALDRDPDPDLAALARREIAAIEALQKYQIGRPHVRRPR